MTNETTFKIIRQGDVEMAHCAGFIAQACDDEVCLFVDPKVLAYVGSGKESVGGCPVVSILGVPPGSPTEIALHDFKGWRFHAGAGGLSIAVSLRRKLAEEDGA